MIRTRRPTFTYTTTVKDFGARGDGVTDDTAAIQAALDYGSSKVVFPSGTYYVSDAAILPNTGQTLVMHGATLVKYVTGSVIDRTQALLDFEDVSDVTILGGTIKRGNDKQWGARFVDGCENIKFHGTRFEDISVYIQRGNTDTGFFDCTFDLGLATGNTCISTGGTIDVATGKLTGAAGVVNGLQVQGCTIIGGGNEALDINWYTTNFTITGNTFRNNGTAGSNDEVIDIGGSSAQSATIAAGGTGYAVGDMVEVPGGTVITTGGAARRARFRVDAVSGDAVTAVSLNSTYSDGYYAGGHYMVFPGYTGLATTTLTGGGSGLTLNVTWGYCSDFVVADNTFEMNPDFEAPVVRVKWEVQRGKIHNNVAVFPETPVSTFRAVKIEQSDDIEVTNNTWVNLGGGVLVNGPSDNVLVEGNTIRGVLGLGVSAGTITSTNDVTNLRVINNTIVAQSASTDPMISLAYADGARIERNNVSITVGNTASSGIELDATVAGCSVIGNKITGGLYGIDAEAGATKITVKDNGVEQVNASGIRLAGQNHNSDVSDNRVRDAGNNGSAFSISVADANWTTITLGAPYSAL